MVFISYQWDEIFRGQTEEKLDQLKRRITETRFFLHRRPVQDDVVHAWHDDIRRGLWHPNRARSWRNVANWIADIRVEDMVELFLKN
jgi:predicted transcriptional regulator